MKEEQGADVGEPWVPQQGLIAEYFDYGVWTSDAPPIYHVAAIAPVIAAMCADTTVLSIANKPYPLHLWSMLVGKSTSDRKTSSANLAISIAEEIQPDRILNVYGSPEGIMQKLAAHPCSILFAPEGGAFFEQRNAGYWKHAKGIFMDLYDYKKRWSKTLIKEDIEIKNPRLSILSACARALLERYTTDTDWTGGFLPRFLMVAGERTIFKHRARVDPTVETKLQGLLRNIHTTCWGPMAIQTQALSVLDAWAEEVNEESPRFPEGTSAAVERLTETAHRLAAIYEIANYANQPPAPGRRIMVRPEAARCAVALCRASKEDCLRYLGDIAVPTGFSRDSLRLEQFIRAAGPRGVSRREIGRKYRLGARVLEEHLTSLMEAGLINACSTRTSGRAAMIYVHTEASGDVQRLAERAQRHQTTSVPWLNLRTLQADGLDQLPRYVPAPWEIPGGGSDEQPN